MALVTDPGVALASPGSFCPDENELAQSLAAACSNAEGSEDKKLETQSWVFRSNRPRMSEDGQRGHYDPHEPVGNAVFNG